MKNILSGMFFVLALSFGFAACSDDNNDTTVYETTPEIASAGTYIGTWTREAVGSETKTQEGTLTLAPVEGEDVRPYVTNVKVESKGTEFNLNKESTANISYAGTDVLFSNMNVTNGFGVKFNGSISADNKAVISFTVTEREGRKTYVFNYSFEGVKVVNE